MNLSETIFSINFSINSSIRDEAHLKRLIFDWKRAAGIGEKPSKNTGSGGRSGQPQVTQLILETFGSRGSTNGVTVRPLIHSFL